MSRLDELIAELCPDGVEYKEIQELFYLKNGYTPPKSNPSNYEYGTIPWFRMEDIRARLETHLSIMKRFNSMLAMAI